MAAEHDLVKRIAELADGDTWQIADLLVEAFPLDEYGNGGKARNGLHASLAKYEIALRDGYGVELKAVTMRTYRATAIAWPHAIRIACASFGAHQALRGDDRVGRMQAYLKHNGGNALSAKVVRRMNADNKPRRPMTSWEVKVARRFESAARSLLLGAVVTKRDDWWRVDVITDEARNVVAHELRALADRIKS